MSRNPPAATWSIIPSNSPASSILLSPGHLARQGPQLLRWALYEAAKCAARPASPAHTYYQGVRQRRRSAGLATLAVARKLARRCYHTLRELDEHALDPAA